MSNLSDSVETMVKTVNFEIECAVAKAKIDMENHFNNVETYFATIGLSLAEMEIMDTWFL